MDEEVKEVQKVERDKRSLYLPIFVGVLFFSLFSLSSFLLWFSPSSLVELFINPSFIRRFITVVISLISFFVLRRIRALQTTSGAVFLYSLSLFVAILLLFFARTPDAKILLSSPPIALILTITSSYLISFVGDDDALVIEDIFLTSFIEGVSIIVLFLNANFAGAIICFLVLTSICFTRSILFGIKVMFLTLFSVVIVLIVLLLFPPFVNSYFGSLLSSESFMNFYKQTETYLSSASVFSMQFSEESDVIFAFLYRLKTIGFALYVLFVASLDVLLFSLSSRYSEEGNGVKARYTYALALYIALAVVCNLLSLVTSLPFFVCEMPFLTMSDVAIFTLVSAIGLVFER